MKKLEYLSKIVGYKINVIVISNNELKWKKNLKIPLIVVIKQ